MVEQFGIFVTSNASLTHIIFDDRRKSCCGLNIPSMEERYVDHPNGEIRNLLTPIEMKIYVKDNRHEPGPLRFCKICLKTYDRLTPKVQ